MKNKVSHGNRYIYNNLQFPDMICEFFYSVEVSILLKFCINHSIPDLMKPNTIQLAQIYVQRFVASVTEKYFGCGC
jgi:hypothetical protein